MLEKNPVSKQWLFRLSYLYLISPLIVFCLGFLRVYIGLPIVFLFLICLWKIWRKPEPNVEQHHPGKDWGWLIALALLWVLLSGIGGFAFQNYDFAGRNAIFRDLIENSWPVFFTKLGSTTYPEHTYALDYYFGFWLLPALFGKLFGWTVANIALFLNSVLGVILTAALISRRINASLVKSILLLIFFSGMDAAGTFILRYQIPGFYPTLWPPITHLEWWQPFQFSSFTTQIFWVFNQSIPVWICAGLLLNSKSLRSDILIWSLCFFFAPLPSVGLAVLCLGKVYNRLFLSETGSKTQPFRTCLRSTVKELFSFENIVAGLICFILFYLFYRDNLVVSTTQIIPLSIGLAVHFLLFSALEWLPFWIVSSRFRRSDITWYLIAPALLLSLFITMGGYFIFSQRATIPILFLLMVWVGEIIFNGRLKQNILFLVILLVGALTPLYEINRSIYRTVDYFLNHKNSPAAVDSCSLPQEERKAIPPQPELDHPNNLLADDWYSISDFDVEWVSDYLAETSNSFFFRYLARR
jgi:hypothetical protein